MLICLTASHKNASFDLLEKLSISAPSVARALVRDEASVAGAVVVATCNRFEAYLDVDDEPGRAESIALASARDAIARETPIGIAELDGAFDLLAGHGVAEHLFAVSSGLESVVVGEAEIAGQVRRSLEDARADGTTTSELERLFQRASQTSRGVKNRTGIGRAGRSLVRLALELADSRVTDWATTPVLVIGTGRYAGATVATLRDLGAGDVSVFSTSGRAPRFAASRGITAVPSGGLVDAVARSSIVIACTVATSPVLDATHVADRSVGDPLLVVDLGLPRNVDPAVAERAGVDLLDLETVRRHAPLTELNASAEARAIVGRAARKFVDVGREQSLDPAVVALRTHVQAMVDAEIERAAARGDDGRTAAALRHLAGVLLHTPSVRARELAREGESEAYVEALSTLFGIDVVLPGAETLRAVDDLGA